MVTTPPFKSLGWISCLFLCGCLAKNPLIAPERRAEMAAELAKTQHWQAYNIPTSTFTFKAYGSLVQNKANVLTVYIEGDGLAWLSTDRPSANPTPQNPMGLKMALQDKKNHPVAYLARPCQFVFNEAWQGCRQAYWTDSRFSLEIIQATNQALDYLKKHYHASQIVLIGYSGGGTIAALAAARRSDVIQLITVAAVLDTADWVQRNNLTPLYGSLNPALEWKNLVYIDQVHWVGGKDTVVPPGVAFAFAKHFPVTQKPNIIVLPEFDHVCCWVTRWQYVKV